MSRTNSSRSLFYVAKKNYQLLESSPLIICSSSPATTPFLLLKMCSQWKHQTAQTIQIIQVNCQFRIHNSLLNVNCCIVHLICNYSQAFILAQFYLWTCLLKIKIRSKFFDPSGRLRFGQRRHSLVPNTLEYKMYGP